MNKKIYIAGAMKSGTTTLHDLLVESPDVFSPEIKEPQYLSWKLRRDSDFKIDSKDQLLRAESVIPVRDEASYSRWKHKKKENEIEIDSSVFNLPQFSVHEYLGNSNEDYYVIVIVREMIERAFSSYVFQRSKGEEWCSDFGMAVEEELNGGRDGLVYPWRHLYVSQYKKQIENLLKYIPENRLKVIDFRDLINGQSKVVEDVCKFCGISTPSSNTQKLSNKSMGNPKSSKDKYLSKFIYTDNRLKRILRELAPSSFRNYMSEKIKDSIKRVDNEKLSKDIEDKLLKFFEEDAKYLNSKYGITYEKYKKYY